MLGAALLLALLGRSRAHATTTSAEVLQPTGTAGDARSADPRNDLALLSVILWTRDEEWATLNRSWHTLRPSFSSLGVDVWDHDDYGVTAEEARQMVLEQHGDVVGLFDEVHFTSTGNRSLVNRHVTTSFSYYNVWSATFGPEREATRPTEGEGLFGVPMPTVIASMARRFRRI